ncbi:MAG: DUF1073 domain-containing protein [Janthinobacterium lividum]
MLLADRLINIMSGLGTEKDKLSHGHFAYNFLSRFDLDQAYDGDWLAATIINAPVDDMTREWRTWNGGPRQSAAMQAEEHRLGVRQKVNAAQKLARQYGGAAILLGTGDKDPSRPLNVDKVRRGGLTYLHVLSRYDLAVQELDRDALSPYYGEPKEYRLASGTNSAVIHPSRIVRFVGNGHLDASRSIDGWGYSVLQRVWDAIRNVASTAANIASLVYEAKVDVISIPGLTQNSLSPDYQSKVLSRFAIANMGKSNQNALILDAEEKWDQKQITFGGLVDVLNKFLEVAAGAANMPVTRLLGVAPKGLNSTGQSEVRAYYDTLAGRQLVELGPAMARLDEALIRSALGARPAALAYEWSPLWQMDEAESAALALQKAQTAQIYGTLGVMPPSALRGGVTNMLQADATYPGLADLLAAAAAANEAAGPIAVKAEETGAEINAPSPGAKTFKT